MMGSSARNPTPPEKNRLPVVVVVDDNEILLRAWQRILSECDLEVFATSNPEAALEFLKTRGADLVISDIVMPRCDGFELVERIGHLSHQPRVVLTTGYVCDFTRLKIEVGSQTIHVLIKPYNDIGRVGEFVRHLLEGQNPVPQDGLVRAAGGSPVYLWNL